MRGAVVAFIGLLLANSVSLGIHEARGEGFGQLPPFALPYPVNAASSFLDGSAMYLVGGRGNDPQAILKIDLQARQVTVANGRLPAPLIESAIAWDGQHAYIVGGGRDGALGALTYDQILIYTPSTGVVTESSARFGSGGLRDAAVYWDGSGVVIIGGVTGNGWANMNIFRYDPVTDRLSTQPGVLPDKQIGAGLAWTGSAAYIFGGNFLGIDALKYIPANGTFETFALPDGWQLAGIRVTYDHDDTIWIFGAQTPQDFTGEFGTVRSTGIVKFHPSTETFESTPLYLNNDNGGAGTAWWQGKPYLAGDGTTEIQSLLPDNAPPTPALAPIAPQECIRGGAWFDLDAGASTDPDGDKLAFRWYVNGKPIGSADPSRLHVWLPAGHNNVTLVATDFPSAHNITHVKTLRVDPPIQDSYPPEAWFFRPRAGGTYVFDHDLSALFTNPLGVTTSVGAITLTMLNYDTCGIVSRHMVAIPHVPLQPTLTIPLVSADDAFATYSFSPAISQSGEYTLVDSVTDWGGHTVEATQDVVITGTGIG